MKRKANGGPHPGEDLPDFPVELMLDSGAFSAWTHDQEIKVEDYIAFIKQYGDMFHSVVNLDVIPGKFGQRKSAQDVERAVAKSYENLQALKSEGINAIPVFHQGENMKHLERMLEDGEEYIGISPSGDNVSMNVRWFDQVFHMITDSDGFPVVKTHGFGVTSIPIMRRFPWFSMDSVTWVIKSGYGCIFIPPPKAPRSKEPNYYKDPISVWVTGAPRKHADRFEYECMGEGFREKTLREEWVHTYFNEVINLDETQIRYNAYARMEAMATYFHEIRRRLVYAPFPDSSGSLVNLKSSRKKMEWPMKKMIFAVGPLGNIKRSDILNTFKIKHRLVSYFDLREINPVDIDVYRRKGQVKAYRSLRIRQNWESVTYLNRRMLDLSRIVRLSQTLMHEDLE